MKKKLIVGFLALLGAAVLALWLSPALLLRAFMTWERRAAGLAERSVVAGDDTFVYLEGGSGPTLLLVHGFGGDKDNWTRFAGLLTDRYHVVAPDLPGFGQSTRDPNKRYDILSQAQRLRAFAQKLGLQRVHIAGNSMGGQIAGVYAAEYPADVASLGLFANAGIDTPTPSELQRLLSEGKNPLLVEGPEGFDGLMKFIFVVPPPMPAGVKAYFAERAVEHRPFNQKIWNDIMNPKVPLTPRLGQIEARTLVLWGDTDRLLDVSAVPVLTQGLKQSQSVILKDCGHVPMLERPDETAEHYLKFLQAL